MLCVAYLSYMASDAAASRSATARGLGAGVCTRARVRACARHGHIPIPAVTHEMNGGKRSGFPKCRPSAFLGAESARLGRLRLLVGREGPAGADRRETEGNVF